MNTGDIHSRYVNALRTQRKADLSSTGVLPCPFPGHHERTFHGIEQLYQHAKAEHNVHIEKLEPRYARAQLKEKALKIKKSDQSSDATAGDRSTPDITGLTIESGVDGQQPSPPLGKKRPADTEHLGRRGKAQSYVDVGDAYGYTSSNAKTLLDIGGSTRPKPHNSRLFDPSKPWKNTEETSNWSHEATKGNQVLTSQTHSPSRQVAQRHAANSHALQSKPGLIELQKQDPRYPGLLLQPDSRPISQEQLASEVKSIYAGLTMVETKCIHVDRNQAAQDAAETKLAPDHWQALIALHRTLLHEHHDFFLASQHPSASLALRRLAGKYSMPARMWKHGIHSFLELLRRRLPESIDYMLAFIYLAYQMMALLYETVPAFEDTWIECLGDLGRYRMAIEDEDLRDRETWAGVARSWYTKAADKNPTVGRLYHHLAILARPNALQQLYYYSRSLTCVKPFPSARESILTLLDPIVGRAAASYSHTLPIDTTFIKSHAILFLDLSPDDFAVAQQDYLNSLDNHIGRVTAKWKEQGVYIAVTNIAGWFNYGTDNNPLRQVFLTSIHERAQLSSSPAEDIVRAAVPGDQSDPPLPSIPRAQLPAEIANLPNVSSFQNAKTITENTFALVLRRIGDKNVLPHVHIMLSFLLSFSSNTYVASLLHGGPWTELASFLNTLIKTENQIHAQMQSQDRPQDINSLFSANVFPGIGERTDELPLPEDYLVRGLIWAHDYFPEKWFERENDEEERYLEHASTVKTRVERVLRLGYQFAKQARWISYDFDSHTFAAVP